MEKKVKDGRLDISPYLKFDRAEWAALSSNNSLELDDIDLSRLEGLNQPLSMDEIHEIYLPMSRLLSFYVSNIQALHKSTGNFLRNNSHKVPFIIGLAGSVAVGKSTSARVLRYLLSRWEDHPRVSLVNTDGFLLPNAVLEDRGIMNRKGFPESYDTGRLLEFLADIKSGQPKVTAPLYSHFSYDVLSDQVAVVEKPDILIVEGLNVLQPARLPKDGEAIPFVSDFFDFSIYIHASEDLVERWYVERFMRLRETAFRDPGSYFHKYSKISEAEARETALDIWTTINLLNLNENILPTRRRADLILNKGRDHFTDSVEIRKL